MTESISVDRIRKTLRTLDGQSPMQVSLTTGAQPTGAGAVPKERLVGWYTKVLEGVKQRSRKLQRLARYVVRMSIVLRWLIILAVRRGC